VAWRGEGKTLMAYLTKGPLGYYVNRQFVLPTPVGDAIVGAAGRGRMGYYTSRSFVLPTSSNLNQQLAAAAQTAKKSCGCHGSCGHCGGKRYTRRGLRGLGDDGSDYTDTSDFSSDAIYGPSPTLDTLALNADTGLAPGGSGIFGPQPTAQTLALNASQGLQPGTSGIASAVGSVLSSIFAPRPSTGVLTPAQQSALVQQQGGVNLGSWLGGAPLIVNPLTLAGIAIGTIVVISLAKGGRRR
jgi:hypothetical protein